MSVLQFEVTNDHDEMYKRYSDTLLKTKFLLEAEVVSLVSIVKSDLSFISINLLAFYHESCSLIGYAIHYLSIR